MDVRMHGVNDAVRTKATGHFLRGLAANAWRDSFPYGNSFLSSSRVMGDGDFGDRQSVIARRLPLEVAFGAVVR
jgi:hypothetical protein